MTTCSSSPRSTVSAIITEPAGPAQPSAETAAEAAGTPYGDPVGDLVHAAVADRPLDEVVDLITSLEQSPERAQEMVAALRAAGVDRSVEDVTRLVALLTRPPRDAGSADETIRAAAAHRSVEDVTRLMVLLHREPLEPHCRQEAVRAAATGRSVKELVELIDRLAAQRPAGADLPSPPPRLPERETTGQPAAVVRPALISAIRVARVRDGRRARRPRLTGRDRSPEPLSTPASWSSRLAAVALALCAVAHFPLHRDGTSLRLHAAALALSVLCMVLALLLAVRPAVPELAGAVLVPAALAGAQVYGSSYVTGRLSRAVDLAVAPPWLATAAAVCASLMALTALVVRVLSPFPGRRWASWPAPEARRMTK